MHGSSLRRKEAERYRQVASLHDTDMRVPGWDSVALSKPADEPNDHVGDFDDLP
jgi:hypothetical protein